MRNLVLWIFIIALVGGISGVLFNKFVIPTLSHVRGLTWVSKLESNTPVIINRREVVQFTDGTDLLNLTKQIEASTVSIYQANKFVGNGIIATSDGMIVTTKSVVSAAGPYIAVLNDGRQFPMAVRALDPKSEIAIATVSVNNLPFVQWAAAADLETSQKLVFIGRSNASFTHEFALGQITQRLINQRSVDRVFDSESLETNITSDAKLTSDFVGGPVSNLEGKIVGLTQSNLGILIAENIQSAISSYFTTNKIVRPALGIKYLNLSEETAAIRGLTQAGVYVISVADGPAKLAGVLPNDLIIAADNKDLKSNNFEQILNGHSVSDFPITVLRGTNQIDLTVKLLAK